VDLIQAIDSKLIIADYPSNTFGTSHWVIGWGMGDGASVLSQKFCPDFWQL
jgi:hypothetical protein